MISRHLRFVFFGGLLGLLVALTPGCQKKCAVDTCAGCCTAKNECVTDTTPTQCGVAGAACSSCATDQLCTNGACETPVVIVEDAGVDAGPPPCTTDFACGPGKICDTLTGGCVMGAPCTADNQCQPENSEDRCYRYGQQCTCDTTANGGGTCRLRKKPCEECTVLPDGGGSHFECGADPVIFGPPGIGAGRCNSLPNDMSGKRYCSYQRVGLCACGTEDDGTGFCRPQSNSCSSVGCNIDKECPSGAVCSVNRPDAGANSCGGSCVPRCRWDFAERAGVSPGCPPGLTCWVDSANLNPISIYYGAGRCKPPCQGNADCQTAPAGSNPFGGTNLKCEGELLDDGTRSPKRCRANGACMDTAECEELRDAGPYIGYCDRGTFVCRADCRTGSDPITGNPFTDCRPPFSCSNDAGVNFCRLETCTQQGGAGIACAQGSYCCGDDKNFDGTPDPCPPLAQQNPAGCYPAPKPPFCTECGAGTDFSMGVDSMVQAMADQECAGLAAPSWSPCANGSKSPNCSPLKSRCQYAGDRAPMMPGIAVCMMPSVNDVTKVTLRYGDTPKEQIACPTNYTVNFVRPQPNPSQGVGYCNTNADCSVLTDGGVSDAGTCEPDPLLRQMDGGLLKACRCAAKSGAAQCPNGTAPTGEVRSFCKDGTTGSRQYCIETAVCTPPRGSVYKLTTEFGCGL